MLYVSFSIWSYNSISSSANDACIANSWASNILFIIHMKQDLSQAWSHTYGTTHRKYIHKTVIHDLAKQLAWTHSQAVELHNIAFTNQSRISPYIWTCFQDLSSPYNQSRISPYISVLWVIITISPYIWSCFQDLSRSRTKAAYFQETNTE
jgi:hypothetical protein